MKSLIFFPFTLFFVFCSFLLDSQNKSLSLEDVSYKIYYQYYINDLKGIKWITKDKFSYVLNDTLFSFSSNKRKVNKIFTRKELITITRKNFNFFPEYDWEDEKFLWIYIDNSILKIDIQNKRIIKEIILHKEFENLEFNLKNEFSAYTVKNNLYITTPKNITISITKDSTDGIEYGKKVHREEFGIKKGIFWSNTGKYLAFYRMNETMVPKYPLINIKEKELLTYTRYPMAGTISHQVKVGILNIETLDTIYLKTGAPLDKYLTNLTWTPTDQFFIIAELNREQNHLKLNLYDIQTGNFIRTIIEEKNDKYVEPLNPPYFINNSTFIWQSQKNGHNHLYLYDLNGNLLKQLTEGDFVVTKLIGSNENNVFFIATLPHPLSTNLFVLDINTKKIKNLTKLVHSNIEVIPNQDFTYFIIKETNPNCYSKYYIIDNEGNKIFNLYQVEDFLKEYKLPKILVDSILSADNKFWLYYRIIYPPNFDTTKKYPLVLYVYGGPHVQLIKYNWIYGASLFDLYLAQNNYIVASIDNRGSANRGFEFETATYKELGIQEAYDQIKFVNFLKKFNYVDSTKIAVMGWSFGGFMTINLMTLFPETFKVGIAGGPVTNWALYEVMYTERYMKTPNQNPNGYSITNLINRINKLKGNLLIIHGLIDDIVLPIHSLLLLEEAINNNINIDFFVYPTQSHNISYKQRLHLNKKIFDYLDSNLNKPKFD